MMNTPFMCHRTQSPAKQKSRRSLLRLMIFPSLFLALSILLALQSPKDNYSSPRPLNYKSQYESFYNPKLPWVEVSVPRLSYTGCTVTRDSFPTGSQIAGYYYYTLSDGVCQFYILDAAPGVVSSGQDRIIKGQLIRMKEAEYEALIADMANQLSWTTDALASMTSPYAVTDLSTPSWPGRFLRLLAGGGVLFALADLLCLLLFFFHPKQGRQQKNKTA